VAQETQIHVFVTPKVACEAQNERQLNELESRLTLAHDWLLRGAGDGVIGFQFLVWEKFHT
jgi:hypothetical protein